MSKQVLDLETKLTQKIEQSQSASQRESAASTYEMQAAFNANFEEVKTDVASLNTKVDSVKDDVASVKTDIAELREMMIEMMITA